MHGRRLGSRYVLGELLGRGAMGQVVRAWPVPGGDLPPGAPGGPQGAADRAELAVKLLRDDLATDPDLVQRFLQESRLLKSVDHPNVVRIRDLVVEGDVLAIVMDLVRDGDLRRAVPTPCPEAEAAQIVAGIAAGLASVHAAGILHRDLKPENVLVERTAPGTGRPRIADFGVSRFDTATSTRTRGMTGTIGYIAPEIAKGGYATPASDVYALGVMLYELCAGRPPFSADHPVALARAHADDPVPRPQGMSDRMWAVVHVLLGKQPQDRPAATQVAAQLRALALELDPALAALPPGDFPLRRAGLPPAPVPDPSTTIGGTPPALPPVPRTVPVAQVPPLPVPPLPVPPLPVPPLPVPPLPVPPVSAAPPQSAGPPVAPPPVVTQVARGAAPTSPGGRPPAGRRRAGVVLATVAATALLGVGGWALVVRPSLNARPTVALADQAGTGTPAATAPSASAATSAPGVRGGEWAGTATPGRAADGGPSALPSSTASSVRVTAARPSASSAPVRSAQPAAAAGAAAAPATTAPARTTAQDPTAGMVPLYRYYSSSTGDHFYTTNYSELGGGTSSYRLEGTALLVYPSAHTGTVPLYRYYSSTTGDHFYTTNYSELGGGTSSYRLEGVQAYVYPSPQDGTKPLYRYYSSTTGDHFYTANYSELGGGTSSYRLEGIAGYGR